MNHPLIIGLSGKVGSGKDYIAKEIIGRYLTEHRIPYVHLAFCDALKVQLMTTMPDVATFDNMFINKTKKTRTLLQTVAMDERKRDDMIWIKYIDAWIQVHTSRGINVIIISDVRFDIEMNYIKSKGGIIFRIISPLRTQTKIKEESLRIDEDDSALAQGELKGECLIENSVHISETNLDECKLSVFDEVIYNDYENNTNIIEIIKKYIYCIWI